MSIEIINYLKRILRGFNALQGVVFNHHTRHEAGGGDEVTTAPTAHASTHEDGGSDEISVAGLSGVLADLQNPKLTEGTHANRPAAGTTGRLYFETDTGICFRDNGAAWEERWRLETATRLAHLAEKSHNNLTNVTANQHHTKTISSEISLADLAEKAHNSLTGVTASQHHTKTTDHGALDGRGDDDHTQYLTTGRHDTTSRHPASVLRTSTGSASGNIPAGEWDLITMHTKSFFPGLSTPGGHLKGYIMVGSQSPSYTSQFAIMNGTDAPGTDYDVRWYYLY